MPSRRANQTQRSAFRSKYFKKKRSSRSPKPRSPAIEPFQYETRNAFAMPSPSPSSPPSPIPDPGPILPIVAEANVTVKTAAAANTGIPKEAFYVLGGVMIFASIFLFYGAFSNRKDCDAVDGCMRRENIEIAKLLRDKCSSKVDIPGLMNQMIEKLDDDDFSWNPDDFGKK